MIICTADHRPVDVLAVAGIVIALGLVIENSKSQILEIVTAGTAAIGAAPALKHGQQDDYQQRYYTNRDDQLRHSVGRAAQGERFHERTICSGAVEEMKSADGPQPFL
jgi:hypothetical protein